MSLRTNTLIIIGLSLVLLILLVYAAARGILLDGYLMRAELPREVYAQGKASLWAFMLALLACGVICGILIQVIVERGVLSRLARLSARLQHIGNNGDLSARIAIHGRDELARLAGAVNGMLSALEVSQTELRTKEALCRSEERYRNLVELLPDAMLMFSDGRCVFANAAGVRLLKASSSADLLGKSLCDIIHADDLEALERGLRTEADQRPADRTEARFYRVDGSLVDVEMAIHPFTYQEAPAIEVVAHDITERRQTEEQLNYLAYYDGLTELPNRLLFRDRLLQAIARAKRGHDMVGVLLLDLERFNEVNDVLGHDIGDQLLAAVAARLAETIRQSDTIARMGGDDFGFVITDLAHVQAAEAAVLRIRSIFEQPFLIDDLEIFTTPSIGVSLYPDDGIDAETLVRNAEIAMYRAKTQGRNSYQFYSPEMSAVIAERHSLENNLRKALERDEMLVYYQPQICLQTGSIVAMEALVRWKHPELGIVPPLSFIPIAEETGIIHPLGAWVLQQACTQNRIWQRHGLPDLRIAINLSACQFQQQDLVDAVIQVLRAADLPPSTLELEITESVAMQDIDYSLHVLRRLHDIGVRIAIDDFGTGYSSLNYLKRLPIHTLKIDRTFIKDIPEDGDDAAIVAAIIAMSHTLKRKVIAEAVETTAQLEFLRSLHCDEVQGYLFSKPIPAEEFPRLLTTHFTLAHSAFKPEPALHDYQIPHDLAS